MGLVEYADRYHAADDQLPVKNHADPKQCVGPDNRGCLFGSAYGVNNNPNDIITMAAFGVLGCVMNKFGFPQAPMALAFVLWNRPQAIADQSQSSFLIFWQTPVARHPHDFPGACDSNLNFAVSILCFAKKS